MRADDDKEKRDALMQMLQANGIKEEDAQRPERVTEIELFLDDCCCMKALGYFVNLKSACLIQQDITKVEGVDACPNLERLQLNENRIEKIEGLENCLRLKKLYLCSNSISELGDGLSGLEQLEVLWVAENNLSSLQGVGLATGLTELNAARNRITSVMQVLDANRKLQVLNLADNRIHSFREVPGLARLRKLSELAFSDPDWGENPICGLSNYSTYTLYHLPGLTVHDRMRVGPEEHQMAETAFSKKRLYYSMRIKLLNRQAADCLKRAKALDEAQAARPMSEMEGAAAALKRIDGYAQAQEMNPPAAHPAEADQAQNLDRGHVARLLGASREELSAGEAVLAALSMSVKVEREALVQSLLLELQTGGNVRLEPGNATRDAWARSMEDFVRGRFRAEDFRRYGISGVRVRHVTRVCNRSLRIRFEEVAGGLEDSGRPLDYLFYVPPPGAAGECGRDAMAHLRSVAQEGLPAPSDGDGDRGVRAALLTSSLFDVEASRLERCAACEVGTAVARAWGRAVAARRPEGDGGDERETGAAPIVCGGSLLVCSVCLAEQEPASSGSGTAKAVLATLPESVLPEFLVEFDYCYESQAAIPELEAEFGPFASFLRDYALFAKADAQSDQTTERGDSKPLPLPPLPKIERLDGASLLVEGGPLPQWIDTTVLERLRVLNLHGRGIRRFDSGTLRALGSLQVLLLAFNSLEALSWAESQSLTQLDVSFNLIQGMSSIPCLPSLMDLDLSWNSLLSADAIDVIARDLPRLEAVGLAGNPMAKIPGWRTAALARLGSLKTLDGCPVSEAEASSARERSASSRAPPAEALLMGRSYTLSASDWSDEPLARLPLAFPAMLTLEVGCSQILPLLSAEVPRGQVTRSNWRRYVDYVDLSGLGLAEMPQDLARFERLRCLDLSDSSVSTLELLAPLRHLEELTAERAALTSVKGAGALKAVRRLGLGCNQICEVMELQSLPCLSQLSLEDNSIDSLDTFAPLTGLMELYLSNNLIEEPRAVLLLKQVPKLIVLDLAGNELCSAPDYRSYTLFHLRRLKVLDGVPVTQAEQVEAEDQYSGKITMEFLEDKLGPTPSCYTCRTLDLSNSSIKELGLLTNELFPALRELNLDGNPFSDLRPAGPLSKLLVLRVNRSKLELDKASFSDANTIGGIASFPLLQVLEMGSCGICDIAPLAQLPLQSLRILHLPSNEITRVEGLSMLAQLRELVLDGNKIKQFDEKSFEGLKSLRELRVESNGLKSLNNLGPLVKVRALYLGANRIAELSELEKLRALKNLLLVQLSQNPVARKPLYRSHIIYIVGSVRAIDGKEVTGDERERMEQVLQMGEVNKQLCQGVYSFGNQIFPEAQAASADGAPAARGGGGALEAQAVYYVTADGRPVYDMRQAVAGGRAAVRSHSQPRSGGLEARAPGGQGGR